MSKSKSKGSESLFDWAEKSHQSCGDIHEKEAKENRVVELQKVNLERKKMTLVDQLHKSGLLKLKK